MTSKNIVVAVAEMRDNLEHARSLLIDASWMMIELQLNLDMPNQHQTIAQYKSMGQNILKFLRSLDEEQDKETGEAA